MTTPFEVLRHWWEYYRERPFLRLVRLFVVRIFRGGGDADSEGLDLSMGVVLTLLALPGGFVSILLFEKYGSLLQWMRGATNVDPFASAVPDEYFFITLSMAVTGGVAIWRWDAIFPDRRDYINLVPLPISIRTIFLANFVAVLFLAGVVAVDVNAASCVLFPVVVGATQNEFLFFAKFAAVHAVGVLLASVFAFLAVFAIVGLAMAILPTQLFKRIAAYIRGLAVVYLVMLLATTFAVPELLQDSPHSAPGWAYLMPSCWFLGFCQSLRGHAYAGLFALGHLAIPGLCTTVVVAFCAYAGGYRRQFVRISEMQESATSFAPTRQWLARIFDHVMGSPTQKGCFRFVWRTLVRSEAHRLVLVAIGGLALVLASQAAMNAFAIGKTLANGAITAPGLSIPFVVDFLIIVGVRFIFEIPVDLRSNWVFRLMLDSEKPECEPLARKIILLLVLPSTLIVLFPVYAYAEGMKVASLHSMLVATSCWLLTRAVLIRFRKLPFTCPLPPFQQHSIVTLLGGLLAFFAFTVMTAQVEAWALVDPIRMIGFVPVAGLAWYAIRFIAQNTVETERSLIFEDSPKRTVEVLQLWE